MYKESFESINLMKINSYYMDCRYSNTVYIKLFDLKEKFRENLFFLKNACNVRKQGLYKSSLLMKAIINPKLIIDRKLNYSFDHTYEINYKPSGKHISGKIAVYTSIYGNYDNLIQPFYKSDKCDYFAITDQELPIYSVWEKYNTDAIPCFDSMDNYHKSKYCKMFPHLLFPDYEYSVWVDGNVQIVADVVPLVDRLRDDRVMGTFKNPLHDCIYTEANFNICQGYVNDAQLIQQVNRYRSEGYPEKYGMREFSVIVRKHNDPVCISLMDQWWHEVNRETMRDQISFPYILWKNNISIDEIQLLGDNWRWNPRFIWYPHNWHISYMGSESNEQYEERR